jgi:hypothetical protein
VLLAQKNAGKCLHLEVGQRFTLFPRKVSHLPLYQSDVLDGLGFDLGDNFLDVLGGQPERRRRPIVELLGIPAHGVIAFGPDVRDDLSHRVAHLFVALHDLRSTARASLQRR